MKKFLSLLILLGCTFGFAHSQAYRTLNVIQEDYVTVNSKEGISVSKLINNQDKSYTVELSNTNRSAQGEIQSNCFEWYLSYKGKRVSDYYQETIRCGKSGTRQVYAWPDEVPAGDEKFVTVQLGRELLTKDRRDDD